ncbi:MAG: hypothetical protein HOV77_00760 [Hamadaea sp.]|uniref:hypothetical protein n=1 Tax=Hamadaea sp. TaxID=2024425 RepID=UPI0017930F21|nr:hypothetical protein [Hamadaea sp.]NUT17695.1 hypothetical protein [Hamadaea sp.]
MSSYGPPAAQPARKAPAVVVTAAIILVVLGVIGLINTIVSFASLGSTVDRFRVLAQQIGVSAQKIDDQVTQLRIQTIAGAVIGLLIALLLLALAYFLVKGSNAARITTWVLCGIGALCACCGGVGLIFLKNLDRFSTEGNQQDQEQLDLARAMGDAVPGWQVGLGGTAAVLQLLGYLAVAILLAMPAANAFFRKVAPSWQPPTA